MASNDERSGVPEPGDLVIELRDNVPTVVTQPAGPDIHMDDTALMVTAAANGKSWPVAGVADTPANQARWEELSAEVAHMREHGTAVRVPWDGA